VEEPKDDLEARMQKVSLLASAIGLGLMVSGFVYLIVSGASLSIPGPSALLPVALKSGVYLPVALAVMSLGIVLLALLPIVRVLLAMWLYGRRRDVLNALAACVVLIELVISLRSA
jgi:uncharacterized membrane protein